MLIESLEAARNELAPLLAEARAIVAFTGAGVSTECGVPDFRSPDSAWRRHPPIPFATFLESAAARAEAWRRKFAMDDVYAGARPGRSHAALAVLGGTGRLRGVITQNIDGLHGAAGLDPALLVELHGNGGFARCLACGVRHELGPIRARLDDTGEAPICTCGGPVKSATIAFGQAVPAVCLARAAEWAAAADLFLVLGSSLVVRPAASLPLVAKRGGACLVIANLQPTPLDPQADLVLRCDVGALLEPWVGHADVRAA